MSSADAVVEPSSRTARTNPSCRRSFLNIVVSLGSATGEKHLPGAQTERRGGAGPVGGLLGGKDPTGRLFESSLLAGCAIRPSSVARLSQSPAERFNMYPNFRTRHRRWW